MTQALEFNIDAAQRELDRRSAQGEDVSHLRVNKLGQIVTAGYPCTDCIIDFIASSGPEERAELRRECRTQAVPFTIELFDGAIDQLIAANRIVLVDDDNGPYFDFPESYYNAQIN